MVVLRKTVLFNEHHTSIMKNIHCVLLKIMIDRNGHIIMKDWGIPPDDLGS